MAETPTCQRCGEEHWPFKRCAGTVKPQPVVIHRPREGYLEFGDRLDQETVRMGETTFARRRDPGERPGSLRAPQMGGGS